MNQGIYTVMPPIPYVDCPKCGYHKEGDDIARSTDDALTDDIIYINSTVKILKDEVDDLRKQLNVARTDINDLTIRVSTLETDLERHRSISMERVKSATQADLIGLKFAIADMKTTALKKTPYYPPKSVFDKMSDEVKMKMTPCPGRIDLTDEEYEKAIKAILEANDKPPVIVTPESPRYIYVIRERAKMCEDGWNIVGNVVYPTFNDANEKMKKLIKDHRQLEPDYEAENLNIIQVRLEG